MDLTLAHLQELSVSEGELVLPIELAISAVNLLEPSQYKLLGWEGWLRYPDGRVGHSKLHQGTVSLDGAANPQAASLMRDTMREAYVQHQRAPEVAGTELLFCITYAG